MHPSEIVPIIAGAAAITPWWQPTNGTTWQIILSQTLDPNNLPSVQAIDSHMYDNSKATWSAVKTKGYKTICYFSSQYEEWRADAADFRAQPWNLGDPLDVWPGERWVNSRALGIRAIMTNRVAIGLKNDALVVPQVVDIVDFKVNESCQKNSPDSANYDEYGFSTLIKKKKSLDSSVVDCSMQG
ncbi:hypothetical protein Slin14017_G113160 [Septoria linicola]|nr:hypothetical protein Slin14017_G113160 [Septoria linicola]